MPPDITSIPVGTPGALPGDDLSEDELLLQEAQSSVALMVDGLNHVYCGETVDYLDYDDALDFAFHSACKSQQEHHGEPRTFAEAMQRPAQERLEWQKAAQNEIQSLVENGVFELVQLPPGCKAIGSRWVFRPAPWL